MANILKKDSLRGSFTIEASIIFSVVFLLVALIVYIFIIMYQYASLESTASSGAIYGSTFYSNQLYVKKNYTNKNLYWRIYDAEAENKKANIKQKTLQGAEPSLLVSENKIDISTHYFFLSKQVTVQVCDEYKLPFGNIFEVFGISPELKLNAISEVPIEDNAEFIRNLDIVNDIRTGLLNSDNKWVGKGTKVNDIIDKLLKNH